MVTATSSTFETKKVNHWSPKFIGPLVGDERVQLLGKDFQKLKDNLL